MEGPTNMGGGLRFDKQKSAAQVEVGVVLLINNYYGRMTQRIVVRLIKIK
jgi:hypothetical protein